MAKQAAPITTMGDAKLKVIAAELTSQVKKSVTIDWTLRESGRARIKVMVKRILNKYGYPPDLQEAPIQTVPAHAERCGRSGSEPHNRVRYKHWPQSCAADYGVSR